VKALELALFPGARRRWIEKLDTERIERAIAAAEARTSGEIKVSVAPLFWGRVERAARRAFERLRLHETRERNGVLLFVVPARRTFYVLGDTGIHERVGPDFWRAVVDVMAPHFRRDDFTEGVLRGIAELGERLAQHFPHRGEEDQNELSNAVDR
jgi:uncharacterized membrane protein